MRRSFSKVPLALSRSSTKRCLARYAAFASPIGRQVEMGIRAVRGIAPPHADFLDGQREQLFVIALDCGDAQFRRGLGHFGILVPVDTAQPGIFRRAGQIVLWQRFGRQGAVGVEIASAFSAEEPTKPEDTATGWAFGHVKDHSLYGPSLPRPAQVRRYSIVPTPV